MRQGEKSRMIVGLILIFLIFGGVVYYFMTKPPVIKTETVELFTNQPGELAYTDLNGNQVSLNQYLGRILVVTTWASWSPFSATDLPRLESLASNYPRNQVTFLAINRKETKEQAARYLATLPKLPSLIIALDPRDHFYTTVGGYAMPEVVVYNAQGEVVLHTRGEANETEIRTAIDALLSPQ